MDLPDHLKAPLKILRKACLAESNVDEKYVNASVNGNLPDVPELKCYILCLFEHGGIIDETDTIDFGGVLHLFSHDFKETIQQVSKECGTIRKIF